MTLDSTLPTAQQITQEITDDTYTWVALDALFNVPTPVDIYMTVNIVSSSSYASTLTTSIQDGMVEAFYGTDGSTPVQMGVSFYSGKFYEVLTALGVYQIISITMQVGSGGESVTTIDLPINEIATMISDNVTVNYISI
jgi:hypothetical protein